MKFSFHRAFLFSAIPIPRNWATKIGPFAMILSILLFWSQATYAAVGPVILNLTPDDYGSETVWEITDSSGTPITEGGPYEDGNTTPITETIDLSIGTGYTFTIYDSYGDGISSPGFYFLEDAEGTVIVSGGEFASEESTQFDILSTVFAIIGTPTTNLSINQAYSFIPTVSGNDGSPLTFSISSQPSWASFDTSTGALTGTPTAVGTTTGIVISVSNGTDTATLTAFDMAVTVPIGTIGPVTINLTPDDYGSETTWEITDSSGTPITEGGPYEDGNTTPIAETIDLPIGTGYTFTIYDSGGDGIYTPGSYSLEDAEGRTVIASDGGFASEESTPFDIFSTVFIITGTPITTIRENKAYNFIPTIGGNDGSPLTFSINTQPTWATFDTSTGALTGTPTGDDIGTTNGIEITVSNGTETATLTAFDITVVANTPPTITGISKPNINAGAYYSFAPTANDINNDDLTFSIINLPTWASFDEITGELTGVPTNSNVGVTTQITISVFDGLETISLAPFNLEVVLVPPSISSIIKDGIQNDSVVFSKTDFSNHFVSATNESLSKIQITDLPTHGILKLGTNAVIIDQEIPVSQLSTLNYIPNNDYIGDDHFDWNGSDGSSIYAEQSVSARLIINPGVYLNEATSLVDLKTAIETANTNDGNDTITLTGDIILANHLPLIRSNIDFIGNGYTLNGDNKYRVFFILSGHVTMENFTIANGLAQGGHGVDNAGGGAGMAGAIFVNKGSNVILNNVHFLNNKAQGGDGGIFENGLSGGGGGLGGNGGFTGSGDDNNSGGGGGGLYGNGGNGGGSSEDFTGSGGGGGGIGIGGDGSFGGNSGILFIGGGGGGGIIGGSGDGSGGGFGGSGDGNGSNGGSNADGSTGGNGGDFGGGGGSGTIGQAGNGGFGGGGGGDNGSGGFGGGAASEGASSGLFGGSGDYGDGGGGGAGLGGAIFVRELGELKLINSHFENNTATEGTGANNGQGKGGAIFIQEGATALVEGTLTFGTAADNTENSATDAGTSNTDNNDIYGIIMPTVSITTSETSPAEEGQTTATITISRATSLEEQTVNFAVTGTATFNEDYTLDNATTFSGTSGTVVIPANTEETSITLTITPVDDAIIDANEIIQLIIISGTGYQVSDTDNTVTLNIEDNDFEQAFTGLYLETSAATILNSDPLTIVGKLSRFPDTNESLKDIDVTLTITAPDGTTRIETTKTHTDTGQYQFENLTGFTQEGAYGFKATFSGTNKLAQSESATEAVLVGASAGYAILVQGKIQNEEGLAAHNKTLHRIYKKFKERGFDDNNIKYFNYDTSQAGVDGLPLKADIAAAFTELQSRMLSNPAPFYVVMIDHGGIDGTFHIYNGNNDDNDVITPTDLDSWLETLESGLSETALKKPRLVMLGACYSGSFIPDVSKSGRIIITSATAQEESYKGPEEPDGIRSGEFFMEEFFIRLNKGDNIKAAFEFATEKTENFTRKGGDANTANRFYDEATQHPLLDDDGDGKGSNSFSTTGDGQQAKEVLLGIGLNYDTNFAGNPAEILSVSNTIYLSATESAATLEAKVNNANSVNSAPVDIRKPSVILNSSGTETSEQLEITNLPRVFMNCSNTTQSCTTYFDQFVERGKYEAFYFVRDNETNDISPIRRSVIYKNYANNPSPSVFDLVEPLDDSEHKTTLMFKWDSSSDSNGPVTYNFIVATDESFNDIVYQQEELEIAMTYVDDAVGLEDQTTYYWKVEAVDPFGERTTSSSVFSLTTNNTNAPPSIGSIFVSSALDFTSVNNATITFPNDTNINPDIYTDQGQYNMLLPPGRRSVRIEVDGYEPREIDLDTTGGTTGLNVELIPDGGLPTQPGLLQFAATTASVNENEGTITILVERVEGSDGAISVDYATAKNSATSDSDYTSISGTLNWKDKEERAKAIYLSILDDQEFEGDETLTITLSNPTGDATLGTQNPITVTIVDDEAAPPPEPGTVQFSSNTYSAEEGDSTVNITVSRTKGSEGLISVQYLVNGTAFLGKDYTGGSGSITWSDSDDADKTLNLKILDDDEVEDTETLTLTLFSPTGEASLGSRDTATLTITDNDVATSAGTLQFKTATQTVNEGEEITLTVTRTNGTDGEVSVQYMTTGESTASSSDYTGSNGELTWANGEDDSQSFTIKIVDDEDVEETESIQFTLLSPTGEATLGSPAQATVNITDNDEAKASALDSNTNAEVLDSENAKADALNSENFKTDALNSENAKADALNSENLKADALNSENPKADALNSESPVVESNAPALESESNASALGFSESNASALESESNAPALESESNAPALESESNAPALDTVQFSTTIYNAQNVTFSSS
jgi:hypothetical protein